MDIPSRLTLDLAAGEAEARTGLHRKVLARMAQRGIIIGAQPTGRAWRYSSASIDAYLGELAERVEARAS